MRSTLLFIICGLIAIDTNAQLYINEVIPTNDAVLADNYGEYDDIIEIYNAGGSAVNLAGYYLSDDADDVLMWQIPTTNAALTTVPAGGYLIFWADDETAQGANHLNFKLGGNGESVVLTAPDEVTTIDAISFPAVTTDYGYGRLPDGSAGLSELAPASPLATNDNSQPQVEAPVITPPDGIYTGTQIVSIAAEAGASVYYTTDGSTPTILSTPYAIPFPIDTSQNVKAIAIKSGFADSKASTNSYIFNPSTQLPILHLTIDPMYLWDDQVGMYVEGTNGISGPCETEPRNWNQDWEYAANVTLYETDGSVAFSEGCGLSISGGCTRRGAKKSFNVSFKSEYGISKLENYQMFESKEETTWDGFKLRSGGNQRINHRTLDATIQRLIENEIDVDQQSSRPVALYLNGQYWGMYSIRDRMNSGYVKTHHPKIDDDNLDLIKVPRADSSIFHWIYEEVSRGDNIAYHQLDDFMSNNSLADPANYEYVSSQIDINAFLNYLIVNIYYNNTDWPGNNLKTWRERSADGKWRWMMFDLEFLLSRGGATNQWLFDQIINSVDNSARQRNPVASNTFRQLMENPDFKAEYIQRTNTYINTLWDTLRVKPIYDEMKNLTRTEIQADFERWGGWDSLTWDINFDKIYDFFVERPEYARMMIDTVLGVGERIDLTFNFDASTNGVVAVHSNYFDLPFNHKGIYHPNVPIEIHAVPKSGYRFAYWQETGNTNATLYQSFTSNTTLTPVFEPAMNVVINEIHYHPTDTIDEKEFIEIYNPDNKAWDLSGYEFSEGICFKFPKGTSIAAGEYIIIAADATQYAGNGYQVFQWESSKLDNDGEDLWLNNPVDMPIDTICYNDGIPWALLADGFGASLELDYPLPADNINPDDWHASAPLGGTPGAQNSTPCVAPTEQIIINEINYNSDNGNNPEDWVELHNPGATSVDISDWTFRDSGNTFTLATGTVIDAGEFLVLARDAAAFSTLFPHLNNGADYIGDFVFNLSNGGERVSLFNDNQCLVDELTFNDNMPWDTIPDGNGPTLSLITPNLDNTLPQSWEASVNIDSPNGTPGRANEPCFENTIVLPNLVCAGFPTAIEVDSAYNEMDFTWFLSGATPPNFAADSTTAIWNNPGTYNLQLITKYYECTRVYTQPITVENCNTIPNIIDDNFAINEDNILSNNVLTNDNDPNNNNLTVNTIPQSNVANGTLTLNADGTFDYTPNPDFYGTDSFTYEVCDDATFPVVTPGSFVTQVAASGDDVEELSTDGSINVTSGDLDLLEDSPDVFTAVGIRMTNITIPQGAMVTEAYFEFVADESQSVATSITISAEATGNALAIPTTPYSLSSKPRTAATTSWANLPAWTIANTYQSADISSVVQEILNRGDWASGNAMTFILEGTGTRTAESFNGNVPPKLVINYEATDPIPANVSLCDTAVVMINVAPENDAPQATNDNITTTEDSSKTGNASVNDSDIDGDNLALNITPITLAQNGSVFLLAGGAYSYTPNPNFYGTDTFEYEICDDGNPVMCDTASVIIDVTPVNDAPVLLPDTLYMLANSTIQDNVLLNDSDIENHNLTATISPMAAPINGSATIQSNGNIDYTPNPDFVGTDSFTYEVCDDGTPSMCNTETVVIIVEPDCVDIELHAWLEGAYEPALGEMRTTLVATRKLLPGQTPTSALATPTPAGQPYNTAPWNYAGTEGAGWTDADYSGSETDWVLVSFRTDIAKSTEVGMTAALLMKDGSLEFPDRCALTSAVASPLYIVLEHRNHIGVMTPQAIALINSTLTYDFRSSDSYRDPTSFGQKQIPTGEWTMFAGDADQSDFPSFDIQGTDKTIWFDNNGVFDYYFSPDFNLDGDINGQDKSLWFDNNGISSRVPK